ncbi:M24 family metallopeptidase [Streptomyces sp. NPDC057877]|uniref:M24 family metallopeptidase n=1 Tax=Streptomyces sp. NPDC057877 TaxID=3346269 RepID=UPI0036A107A4
MVVEDGTSVCFTERDYAARMARAARDAVDAGLAGLLLTTGSVDLVRLCGHRPRPDSGRLTLLVVVPEAEPRLLVPVTERPAAEASPGAGAVRITDWRDGENPYAAAAGLLRPSGHYGVCEVTWALHLTGLREALPLAAYRPLAVALPLLRAVKDDHEVARMAAAGAAADAVYEEILDARFAGRRETDVAAELARLLRAHGHSRVDVTVVGSGPNGADPRHTAGDRVIEPGDMVVLGFGGLKDGYGSDTTRTVHVGEPTPEERAVHEVVRAAHRAAAAAVRPGVPCHEVDRAARTVIEEAGYGTYRTPRTGHGIGITIDEPPYLTEEEPLPLASGMCLAIEPSLRLPGRFGVRLESTLTCTETGACPLSRASQELAVVA